MHGADATEHMQQRMCANVQTMSMRRCFDPPNKREEIR